MSYTDENMTDVQKIGQCAPKQTTCRERLAYQRHDLKLRLDGVEKAIAALDAHPELEDFIETLARAGA